MRLTRHAPSEHRSDNRTSEQRIGNGTKLRDGLRPAEKEAADAKIKAKANAAAAKARAKEEKKQAAETKKRAKKEAKRPRPQRRLCMPTRGSRIRTARRAPRPDEKNGRAPCVMGPKGSAVNIKPVAC